MTIKQELYWIFGVFIWFCIGLIILLNTNQIWPIIVNFIFCIGTIIFINVYYRCNKKYKLSEEEIPLWNSLTNKAYQAYTEHVMRYPKWYDNICPPGILNYTSEENNLLEKIHKYFYGDDWYISMPISGAQVNYIMWEDVKDKVII